MTKKNTIAKIGFTSMGILLAIIFIVGAQVPKAHAALINELDFGSRGSEVTQLQEFLATNPMIYPAGIVSGNFGPLTRSAVAQFQLAYDLPQVGRVGPMTRAKINEIMSSGFGLDTSAPNMDNKSMQIGRNDATINWTTNELAQGQVYYDLSPIRSDEASGHTRQETSYVSGTSVPNNAGVRTAQSVVISGLQPNTPYYYFTRAIDNSKNVNVTLSKMFRTNQ